VERNARGDRFVGEELVRVAEGGECDDFGLHLRREQGEPLVRDQCTLTMKKET
jgi:hypothetical protein